jgi:hypothetical protein
MDPLRCRNRNHNRSALALRAAAEKEFLMRPSWGEMNFGRRPGVLIAALVGALVAVSPGPAVGTGWNAEAPAPSAIPGEKIDDEQACAMIRRALHNLATAERAQAFALDLDPDGRGDSAMVQAQLAILLERSDELRDALRVVRRSAVTHDERVVNCLAMGLSALAEAERLSTTVEEVLYGPDLGNPMPGANIRSDAAPTAVAPPGP